MTRGVRSPNSSGIDIARFSLTPEVSGLQRLDIDRCLIIYANPTLQTRLAQTKWIYLSIWSPRSSGMLSTSLRDLDKVSRLGILCTSTS